MLAGSMFVAATAMLAAWTAGVPAPQPQTRDARDSRDNSRLRLDLFRLPAATVDPTQGREANPAAAPAGATMPGSAPGLIPIGPAAPAPSPPPQAPEPELPLLHEIAITVRGSGRVGSYDADTAPRFGFGVGGTLERRYANLTSRVALGAALDFAHHRFARSEQGSINVDGMEQTFGATREVSHTSFVALQTVALTLDRLRLFVALGGGIASGNFESVARAYRPGYLNDTQLLGRASVGVDIAFAEEWGLALRTDYTAVRRADSLITTDGRQVDVFGDLFDVCGGLFYRF